MFISLTPSFENGNELSVIHHVPYFGAKFLLMNWAFYSFIFVS